MKFMNDELKAILEAMRATGKKSITQMEFNIVMPFVIYVLTNIKPYLAGEGMPQFLASMYKRLPSESDEEVKKNNRNYLIGAMWCFKAQLQETYEDYLSECKEGVVIDKFTERLAYYHSLGYKHLYSLPEEDMLDVLIIYADSSADYSLVNALKNTRQLMQNKNGAIRTSASNLYAQLKDDVISKLQSAYENYLVSIGEEINHD